MARARKKPADKLSNLYTVRLTPEVANQVEVIRNNLQHQTPYANVTTADVLRYLISTATATEGIDAARTEESSDAAPTNGEGGE